MAAEGCRGLPLLPSRMVWERPGTFRDLILRAIRQHHQGPGDGNQTVEFAVPPRPGLAPTPNRLRTEERHNIRRRCSSNSSIFPRRAHRSTSPSTASAELK